MSVLLTCDRFPSQAILGKIGSNCSCYRSYIFPTRIIFETLLSPNSMTSKPITLHIAKGGEPIAVWFSIVVHIINTSLQFLGLATIIFMPMNCKIIPTSHGDSLWGMHLSHSLHVRYCETITCLCWLMKYLAIIVIVLIIFSLIIRSGKVLAIVHRYVIHSSIFIILLYISFLVVVFCFCFSKDR